jgi:hypothetical protein
MIKIESHRQPIPRTSVYIQHMLNNEIILNKNYSEAQEDVRETQKEVADDLRQLVNRRGKLTDKQSKRYMPYMDIYLKMLSFARRFRDLKIIFCVMQYDSYQTSISIESIDDKTEAFMVNIDETQPESMDDLIKICNQMIKNMDVEAEEDDEMDVVEAAADKVDSLFNKHQPDGPGNNGDSH